MASGALPIAPNSGGVREYADPSNAGLADATSPAFASMLRSLLEDHGKRRSMMNSAMRTARRFSLKSITDRYLDLYESLVRIVKKALPLEAAKPVFISPPPSRIRKAVMWNAAGGAASTDSLLASVRTYWAAINVRECFGRRERIDESITA
jgi:hypothetical protein